MTVKRKFRQKNKIENIYFLYGVDKNGKATIILTYYSDNDDLFIKSDVI